MWYNIPMKLKLSKRGFSVLEVLLAIAIFLIFAIGVYSGIQMVFKIVYQSRMRILETAILNTQLEVIRNMPYENVGVVGGVPAGVLRTTSTITQSGVDFNLVTTVRNIDDPIDGTIGGYPADLSPADYKLVEISAICANCAQKTPVSLSTIIAPDSLEGASENGALFVHVFGATGQPISGATVQIQGGSTTINDTTDINGLVKVIDIPTGTMKYHVTATKGGYSQDQTYEPTAENTTPTKLPITVVSKMVSETFLSIDLLGSLNVETINETCSAIPNAGFTIRGHKIIGSDPEVYKYNHYYTTDAAGVKNLGAVEWDTYEINVTGTSYDIAGTIPINPLIISPGLNQVVSLILKPHTQNSLLVKVKDAGTGLPLSGATVRLRLSGSYDQSKTTGLGFARQTDWSGGSGQVLFTLENKYFSDNGSVSTPSAGDLTLKKSGNSYESSGILESSTFDLGSDVNFINIIPEPQAQPAECGTYPIKFQIAASTSSTPGTWIFRGPDGSTSTYYSLTDTVLWDGLNNNRYMRYKVYLSTADTKFTPTLSEVAFTYNSSCVPPGQAFFSGLSSDLYTLDATRSGYSTNSGEVEVSGRSEVTVNMSPI